MSQRCFTEFSYFLQAPQPCPCLSLLSHNFYSRRMDSLFNFHFSFLKIDCLISQEASVASRHSPSSSLCPSHRSLSTIFKVFLLGLIWCFKISGSLPHPHPALVGAVHALPASGGCWKELQRTSRPGCPHHASLCFCRSCDALKCRSECRRSGHFSEERVHRFYSQRPDGMVAQAPPLV